MITNPAEAAGDEMFPGGVPGPRPAAEDVMFVFAAYPNGGDADPAAAPGNVAATGQGAEVPAEFDSAAAVHAEFDALHQEMLAAISPILLEKPVTAIANEAVEDSGSHVAETPATAESGRLQKAMHVAGMAIRGATSPANIKRVARTTVDVVKETGWRGAVVLAELNPVTNEGARYSAFATADALSHSNPWVGAAVLGGTTALVEGAGALAASGLAEKPISRRFVSWVDRQVRKVAPGDTKLSTPATAGIAMTFGTPVLMAAQQRENMDRTSEEARTQGLRTVAMMTGVFAVEGWLTAKGISKGGNIAEKIGAGLIITAGLFAGAKVGYSRLKSGWDAERLSTRKSRVVGITAGGELSPERAGRSARVYEAIRDRNDEAVKVGLYGEDLAAAIQNPDSVLVEYARGGWGRSREVIYDMPILVPARDLKWYNMGLLEEKYGQDTQFYYFAHPTLPKDAASLSTIENALKEKMEEGAVIITDSYRGENGLDMNSIFGLGTDGSYVIENLGGGDKQRTGMVFAAPVKFEGVNSIRDGASIYEIYQEAVDGGEIIDNSVNGTSVLQTIDGADAERIWEIYDKPFDDLGKEHPMKAGFDEEELMGILADPNVAKIVNRVDGKISTLCFFVTDFDQCPWFNKMRAEKDYGEYFKTNNILIFPGIVTDESMRGNDYATHVVDLAVQLFAKRGSNALVMFECTEISGEYIPILVEAGINNSGLAKISEEVREPISITDYYAVRKAA